MITSKRIEEAAFQAIKSGSTDISSDVREAFIKAISRESDSGARDGLEKTLESIKLAEEYERPSCADTGWPIFYIKAGNEAQIEGGFMALEEAIRDGVRRATKEGYIRKTMKHPLTGFDPGDNIGANIPDFTYQFVPGDSIEITYCAKGGGSECFGGTRQKVVAFADGTKGIEKFVIDAFADAARAGAICPPSIVGVGIGGTANVAANLAKEAACLRLVGSHHPEENIRTIEERLYKGINGLGFGILGAGGSTSALAVNVEYAYTHIAGIVVAISCNCMVARRATYRISADDSIIKLACANWFGDR
ncbi:MAG: fumarate hydratase [Lachnospiraceae bacterium]|nr:fumarate hydratase [Lachnospiraceae bacterium]